ncbi:MAG TPA: alpha/beta fold hydrolase [Terriglobales bacterium]|nr:alpha/beta fold hydrolase [Terriglobales bacterium]
MRKTRSTRGTLSIRFFLFFFAVAASLGQTNHPPPGGETLWIKANGLRLKTVVYRNAGVKPASHLVLVVVLHGDLPKPMYHYKFAGEAAAQLDNVVVAAMLRPGYTDGMGDRSEGEMGQYDGDNYTPEVVDAVADAIKQLKEKSHPARTVLVGHSGGAAITGDLLGRWPSLVNAALMVSCPCDVPAWRKHMLEVQKSPIWLEPVKSLSPLNLAEKIPRTVRVRMLVGADDPVAPPEFSRRYAEALRKHGDDVSLTVLPGLKHNILLQPPVMEALREVVRSIG